MKQIAIYEDYDNWSVELTVQGTGTLYVDGLTLEAAQALKMILENAQRLSIRTWARHDQ